MHRTTSHFNPKLRIPRIHELFWPVIRSGLLIGISYVILFPILTKLSGSFMDLKDLYDPSVLWIPRRFTLENYRVVFNGMYFPEAFSNSLKLTVMVSVFQLISCTTIGYGFARFPFKGSNILFAFVILTLIVPPQMMMIPLYLTFRYFNFFGLAAKPLNLMSSYWPFILLSLTGTGFKNGLFIYIIRQYFRGMPKELEDAASVDGANAFRIFLQVMLPGAVPVLVIVFLFSFVWQWNDYFYTSIFLSTKRFLPLTLEGLKDTLGITGGDEGGLIITVYNNTGSLMFMAPLLILYAFMQRSFIESIERSGIVG